MTDSTPTRRWWLVPVVCLGVALTAQSPDGRSQGDVYVGGLLGCDYSLFPGPRGAMFLEKVSSLPIDCANRGAVEIVWPPDGGVELTTDAGTPAPPDLFGPMALK